MKWRWCVCDLDGTLLNPQGIVARQDREALGRLSQAGLELVLATGRLDLMALRFAHELGVTAPIVACNGGLIREPVSRTILHARAIAPDAVKRLRNHLDQRRLAHLLYTADAIYFTPGNSRLFRLRQYNAGALPEHRVPLSPIEELDRLASFPPTLKLLVTDTDEDVLPELEGVFGGANGLAMVISERRSIDITASGTSKGEGLEVLARVRGMDLSRTVAFGDSHNDLSMLERCGLPIAMGNAEPEVKQISRFVTRSNAEWGVAHAIETVVLSNGLATE